ncbi:MAG: RNA polymerase factor sigma-54 [Treponema sp.]|nr:RNA polymerase factor sigma-54 [Treponema sp.]
MQIEFSQRQNQNQSQKMKQTQTMRLSQKQIQSLNLLAMGREELVSEINRFAQKNPALEINVSESSDADTELSFVSKSNKFDSFSDYEKYSSSTSRFSSEMSDNFQSALESSVDSRESLSDHLLHQLNSMDISEEKNIFCTKLIENLDKNGFHILSVDSIFKGKKEEFKDECLKIVRNLDPVGTCCMNSFESLKIQAEIIAEEKYVPECALFILDGHLDFLEPPQIPKITKKLNRFLETQRSLKFANEEQKTKPVPSDFSESDVEDALAFIKTLEPFPARNFSSSQLNFISPDVYVDRIPDSQLDDGETPFRVRVARGEIPDIRISKSYERFSEKMNSIPNDKKSEKQKSEADFSRESVEAAKSFMDSVAFRENTLQRACAEIVGSQLAFFEKGPRFLVPLRQKDVADKIGVDVSTVSRMANQKYLLCDWGLFELGYFFTNAVNAETVRNQRVNEFSGNESAPTSKEGVKFEIAQLLKEHAGDKKPLSDQKISDLLSAKGIKIARRTVAKYRSELQIDSSYSR